jgi:hypothetical protein
MSALHGQTYTMSAGNARRLRNLLASIPQHPRMVRLPIDRQRFIYLHILAGLHGPPAQNALAGVVAIKRIRVVLRIRLRRKRPLLVLHAHLFGRVVDRAVAVVVVAHCAVKVVVAEYPVERLALCDICSLRRGRHCHPRRCRGAARPHQLAVHFHQAGVAGFNGPELWVIANLRQVSRRHHAVDGLHQRFPFNRGSRNAVKRHVDIGVLG